MSLEKVFLDMDVARIILYEAPNKVVLQIPVLLPKRKKEKGIQVLTQ